MSEIKTEEHIPAKTVTHTILKCDGCGKEQNNDPGWERKAKWGQCSYIEVEIGYEQDGTREGVAWDFCPECFQTKVRPLLETISQPRKVDESW